MGRFGEIDIFFILPSKEISLNILGLLCRFEEINIFFFLPSKKTSLIILGLLCRIEEINIFIILPSKKTPVWVFFAELNKYFYYSTKHKKDSFSNFSCMFLNPNNFFQFRL